MTPPLQGGFLQSPESLHAIRIGYQYQLTFQNKFGLVLILKRLYHRIFSDKPYQRIPNQRLSPDGRDPGWFWLLRPGCENLVKILFFGCGDRHYPYFCGQSANMKSKLWIGVVLAILGFSMMTACGKGSSTGFVGCTDEPVGADSAVLLNFASANSITPVKDTSGLYYQIINQGTGGHPQCQFNIVCILRRNTHEWHRLRFDDQFRQNRLSVGAADSRLADRVAKDPGRRSH